METFECEFCEGFVDMFETFCLIGMCFNVY